MTKMIGKWLYFGGLVVAFLAGAFAFSASWLSLILLLVGIVAAVLFLGEENVNHFGIQFLVLAAVAGALDSVPAVGKYFTGGFTGVVAFLAPVVLTLIVYHFVMKFFMAKK
jgi:hypothetical protein